MIFYQNFLYFFISLNKTQKNIFMVLVKIRICDKVKITSKNRIFKINLKKLFLNKIIAIKI